MQQSCQLLCSVLTGVYSVGDQWQYLAMWNHVVMAMLIAACVPVYCNAAPQLGGIFVPLEVLAAFGNFGDTPSLTRVTRIAFRPEDGLKNRVKFQEKHGIRGEKLIERFGQGLPPGPPSILDDHLVKKNNLLIKRKLKERQRSATSTTVKPLPSTQK